MTKSKTKAPEPDPNADRVEWLRTEVERLEADELTTEGDEDPTTGLTRTELHLLEQYRHDLRVLTADA